MANTPIQNIFPNAAQVDVLNAALQQIAGKIGVAATIQIVRVDTLPAGESATITEAPGSTESARQYIIGIPAGQDGDTGAAAGFGTIQATVTELESGQQPTVEAQLSGPDTAKNITFTFGIPKGKDGNPGDPGAAAGFGTISATATKLDSGAQPTVQAEWSGPDTAKNLTMTFGIPEGPQGPAYALTPEDKQAIVQDVLAALPNAEGVGF